MLCLICLISMSSLDWELVSSTLPHKIYLVKHCFNVAATFVSNEHTVIIEQSTRDLKTLLQRCKNVKYYSLAILKKKHILLEYLIYLFYNLPCIEWFLSIKNSCHLHCQARYMWWDVTTTLLCSGFRRGGKQQKTTPGYS